MKALYLTHPEWAFPLMDTKTFDDNGGEPEGNTWLSVDFEESDAAAVVAADAGVLVEAMVASPEAMLRHLDLAPLGEPWGDLDRSERQEVLDMLFGAANDRADLRWAYYSKDARFIFVEAR